MLYTLPNGKEIDIPIEILTADDAVFDFYIREFMANDAGYEIKNPFHSSHLSDEMIDLDFEPDEFPDDDLLLRRDDV